MTRRDLCRDRDHRAHRLCRLLGFGLLAVHPGGTASRSWPNQRRIARGRTSVSVVAC
jgi:hypothetical protein